MGFKILNGTWELADIFSLGSRWLGKTQHKKL